MVSVIIQFIFWLPITSFWPIATFKTNRPTDFLIITKSFSWSFMFANSYDGSDTFKFSKWGKSHSLRLGKTVNVNVKALPQQKKSTLGHYGWYFVVLVLFPPDGQRRRTPVNSAVMIQHWRSPIGLGGESGCSIEEERIHCSGLWWRTGLC